MARVSYSGEAPRTRYARLIRKMNHVDQMCTVTLTLIDNLAIELHGQLFSLLDIELSR